MTSPAIEPGRASLVALSAAIAGGNPGRVALRLAEAEQWVEPAAVEEAVLQSYLFVGFPAALNALALWRERHGTIAAPSEDADLDRWRSRGEEVCRTVYSSAYESLRQNVALLHPDLEVWMLTEGYGKVLGRPGLELPVRELCIAGLLAALDAPRQLHSHLRGCLNAGVPADEVAAALEIALQEATAADPPAAAVRAERHRAVWSRVRGRHEGKDSSDRETPGEEE